MPYAFNPLTGKFDYYQAAPTFPFASGAVVFGNGSGALQTDNSFLHWDDTNHRLDICGTSPDPTTDKLYVNGKVRLGGITIVSGGIAADSTSRSIALSGYSPLVGAGGNVSFNPGDSITTGLGGIFYAKSGACFKTGTPGHNTQGGNANFIGGDGGDGATTDYVDGGFLQFAAGSSYALTYGNGGDLLFAGGSSYAAIGDATQSHGGNVLFYPGSGPSAAFDGKIKFQDATSADKLIIDGNGMNFGTYTAGVVVQTGYISVRDLGGTVRRLLVG